MMKKIVVFGIAVVLVLVAVFLVARRRQEIKTPAGSKIKVAASFYVLAEFAKQIGGEKIDEISITPFGAEPHEYEPTPKEIADIYSAKLFVFQGGGFDSWAERLSDNLRGRGETVVSIMDRLALKNPDPHIWLDPIMARKEVEIIRDALVETDPPNAVLYQKNSANYLDELSLLDEKYKDGLAECAKKDFVASHSAFEYLARRYGLSFIPIVGMSTEEEPSPRKIAEIIELMRARDLKFIFTEPLADSRAVQTIAQETGAKILTLNPIEGLPAQAGLTAQDAAAGKDYISLMEENLDNLRLALSCNAK